MNLELNVNKLGYILKKIEKRYDLNILIKSNLSGGWMTATGKAIIEKVPAISLSGKKDNIIDIRIEDQNKDSMLVKLTGANDKLFKVEIASSRYKKLGGGNEILISNDECKLKIDKNIIFTIKTGEENIIKLIEE